MNEIKSRNQMLAEIEAAQSVADLKKMTVGLQPLQEYARQSAAAMSEINDLAEARVTAMCKGGYILRGLERDSAGRNNTLQPVRNLSPYRKELVAAGLDDVAAHRWQTMSWAWKPEDALTPYCREQRERGKTITAEDVFRLGKKAMPHEDLEMPTPIEGKYGTLVIDPPWPMQRIERDVAPNQAGFDYPTMSEEEIENFELAPGVKVPDAMEDDAHVFLWTTQKFLPMAQRLFEKWGVKYVLIMVWHKPGGFQPFGLPQYNCEFALYGRKGAPEFIVTKDFPCCFSAPRREHSRKPDEFYDMIRRVTVGKRIEVFAREGREGYDTWGNQSEKFSGSANMGSPTTEDLKAAS